ncbi:MAG TPA: tetratricopeptide repeat protein [Pyrinomonadaceae bacterium]|nr:tetratricopeptide repeat protein [Pyrinomonadaceae bacterium]
MKARIFAFVTAALFVLSAPAPARTQQGGHTIRGKLRNATGDVLPRIIVDLQTGNGFPIGKTTTTEDGDFEFNGLPGNSFLIVVTHPDYESYQERVEFLSDAGENRPGETRAVEMTLTPKPGARLRPGRVAFAQSVPPAALAAFERGTKLSREGKPREAATELREAVRLFPDYFDAHFTLGAELLRAGDHEEAIKEFEHARRINPKDDVVYGAFGAVMMLQRKFAVAAAVYAEAARLAPRDPQYQLFRGMALVEHAISLAPAAPERRQALDAAEAALRKAFDLSNRRLASVHQQLARVYERRGEPARAADELEKYLRANPGLKNADALRQAIKTLRASAATQKP